jgi:hypothetical protein
MLATLWDMLSDEERETISPVFRITDEVIGHTLLRCEEKGHFLVCSFRSESDDRCPFELSFGRGAEIGRFNWFLGLGAEFYNYELFSDGESQSAIREDLDRFLRSDVRCERVIGSKGVSVEVCVASKLVLDGSPIRFTFRRSYRWPFSKYVTQRIEYRPWID